MMITNKELAENDYVDYEAALALRQVGYDMPTHTHFADCRNIVVTSKLERLFGVGKHLERPILQKAVEWLREYRKVSLRINYSLSRCEWFFDYLDMEDGSYDDSTSPYDDVIGYFDNYNEAMNAGIVAICKHLKDTI